MSKNRMIIIVAMVVALFSMGVYAQKGTGLVTAPVVSQVKSVAGGEVLCPCGLEIVGSLWTEFGVHSQALPKYSDQEAIDGIIANYNDPLFRRISIARMYLWNMIALRGNMGPYGLDAFVIPTSGSQGDYNTWRVATLIHPVSHKIYDLVYWYDLDDSSWAIYFRHNSMEICTIVYEN